ncbi:MAG: phasin family protein [Acidobacteriota bacterium]|nr:phasin family protein [Acidobacteriota bacterium]
MTAASATETRDSESKPRSVVESAVETAHKVALAGAGVAGEAADVGAKIFDRLVARGAKVESQGRESLSDWRDKAEEKVQQVRSAAEKGIEQTKSKARSGFEQTRSKARTGIDEHLERRLEKLGVPGQADLEAVIERLSAIEARLDALEKPKPRRRAAKKKTPAKAG